LESAVEGALVNRSETVVLLVTGREVKSGGEMVPDRVSVVDQLDDVKRALAGDLR
jgi:threonine synthase